MFKKRTNKIISVILSIALIMSMCCVALVNVSAASTDTAWYVAGIQELCNGIHWLPGAPENQMTYNDETGLYEITFSQVGKGASESQPFSFEFKVTSCTDDTWSDGKSYPNETENFSGAISAQDDVKITLNAETGEVKWYSNSKFVITNHIYRVAGASNLCGSNWSSTDNNNKMTYNGATERFEKVYTKNAGTYEWKITMDGSKWIPDGMGNNQKVTVTQSGSKVTIWYDEATGKYGSEVTVPTTEPATTAPATTVPETTAEPTTAPPEITFTDGPFTFTTTSANTVKLMSFDGSVTEVVIPETVTYDGVTYTVTETKSLSNTSQITSLSIPGSIKIIPSSFCPGNTSKNLTHITLNEGIESIKDNAFIGTYAEEIILPSTIKSINKAAFGNSEALKKVVINSDFNIMSDVNSPFTGSKNATYYLYSMNNTFSAKYPFPQTAPVYTYPGSTADKELSGTLMIRYFGVEGPQKGEFFDIDGNTYKVIKRIPGDADVKANLNTVGENVTEITIPSSVTEQGVKFNVTVGSTAFNTATSLTKIVIPEEVSSISAFVSFNKCTALKDIYIYNNDFTISKRLLNGLDFTKLTIYAYEGSNAQTYATDNSINFVALQKLLGDVDGDGALTVSDATTIQSYLAELISENDLDLSVADYTKDGVIDVCDATYIQLVIAEIVPTEPVTTEPETTEPETTEEPTTEEPTTEEPTTEEPTTEEPTTEEPTTEEPTTEEPTTVEPTTVEPTTVEPTTVEPTTVEPTTVEPTTEEPTTEEPTTEEPTTVPETKYYIAGDEGLVGVAWNASGVALTKGEYTYDSASYDYSVTFSGIAAGSYAFKITDGTWSNCWGKDGGNFPINLTKAADVTVYFNSDSKAIAVESDGIGAWKFEYITAAGNGDGAWLNGENWNPAAEVNKMTEVEQGIWEITYTDIPADNGYEVKFACNGSWQPYNWTITGELDGQTNTPQTVEVDGSTVTLRIDVTGFDFATGVGTVKPEFIVTPPTTEPTTAEPTTVEPTTAEPTTEEPTTEEPTTEEPTTEEPTTEEPTTVEPTTVEPTTEEPTTVEPTTVEPTTVEPTTVEPTTVEPTTVEPTTVEPTTVEPTTVEPTTEEPTTEPTTEPEAKYYIAGDSGLVGVAWDPSGVALTKGEYTYDGAAYDYSVTFNGIAAGSYAFKITDGTWSNCWGKDGGNFTVNLTKAADVTVYFNSDSKAIAVESDGIGAWEFEYITAAGNGDGAWLYGENWNPAAEDNKMTEVEPGIWEITYTDIPADNGYEVKFACNGSWQPYNWTITGELDGQTNTPQTVEVDGSTVTLRIDVTGFDFATGQGTVKPEFIVTPPTTEPTTEENELPIM